MGLAACTVALGACGRTDGTFAGGSGLGSTDTATGGTDPTDGNPSTSTVSTTGRPPGTATTPPTTATATDADTEGPEPGGECRVADDCRVFEPDPCLQAACELGRCVYAPLDRDGDGLAPLACGGLDCNDANPFTFPGAPEDCFDGDDNDCNGVADCSDPVCRDVPDCGCVADPAGERCDNGRDDDCDTRVDCNDPECVGTAVCGCAEAELGDIACGNGVDDDCDGRTDCDDAECAAAGGCACVGTFEECSGGEDDDCDLLVDCADPDCSGIFPCNCPSPATPEFCGDGIDNDCDGAPDCADPECLLAPECQLCTSEDCTDGLDNSCDGRIDCADPACALDPACRPTPELCNNDLDDDRDGAIDCDDPDCVSNPTCDEQQATCATARVITASGTYTGSTEGNVNREQGSCGGAAGEAVFELRLSQPAQVIIDARGTSFDSVVYLRSGNCGQGRELACDDDSGGNFAGQIVLPLLYPGTYYIFLDGFTVDPFGGPNEGDFALNVAINRDAVELCDNGIDDDGDVYADCADPDCAMDPRCAGCDDGRQPEPEFGPERCTDGRDNDCDGRPDCGDEDCSKSDYYVNECCTGSDQNGNGIADDFNCACASDADCIAGQICYTSSAFACGLPCTAFFGDVCPFVAPGSACNATTGQCEF